MSDEIQAITEIYKMIKEKKEKEKVSIANVFVNQVEYLILGSLLKVVLSSNSNLIVYEVENYENLFDYAHLFMRVRNVRHFNIFGKSFTFIPVISYPHNVDLTEAVDVALEEQTIPVVAYFVSDFIPSSEGASSSDMKELTKILAQALFNKTCYVILFTTNIMVLYDNIPLARYGVLIKDIAPRIIREAYPKKAKYVSIVGFGKLLTKKSEEIEEYIRKRKLPTPHTIERLARDIKFDELILPDPIREFLRVNIINPLKTDYTLVSSLLFVGPPGSGKTTLAYTIAKELGITAHLVRVELMGSKWFGESEKIANQTLLLLNDRAPTVAVFRDVELILGERRRGGEEAMVYERIRAIISTWLRSPRRRFIAIFTVSDPKHLPDHVIQDATFGLFKLPILPPLKSIERRQMLILFFRKLAPIYGLRFDPLKESISEALDAVAEETWAYTPRELLDVAKTAINITLDRGLKEITKEAIQLARKYREVDRISRVELMKDAINICKKVGIPEPLLVDIYRFEEEVEQLKARAYAEESKKRSLAKISR